MADPREDIRVTQQSRDFGIAGAAAQRQQGLHKPEQWRFRERPVLRVEGRQSDGGQFPLQRRDRFAVGDTDRQLRSQGRSARSRGPPARRDSRRDPASLIVGRGLQPEIRGAQCDLALLPGFGQGAPPGVEDEGFAVRRGNEHLDRAPGGGPALQHRHQQLRGVGHSRHDDPTQAGRQGALARLFELEIEGVAQMPDRKLPGVASLQFGHGGPAFGLLDLRAACGDRRDVEATIGQFLAQLLETARHLQRPGRAGSAPLARPQEGREFARRDRLQDGRPGQQALSICGHGRVGWRRQQHRRGHDLRPQQGDPARRGGQGQGGAQPPARLARGHNHHQAAPVQQARPSLVQEIRRYGLAKGPVPAQEGPHHVHLPPLISVPRLWGPSCRPSHSPRGSWALSTHASSQVRAASVCPPCFPLRSRNRTHPGSQGVAATEAEHTSRRELPLESRGRLHPDAGGSSDRRSAMRPT